MIIMLYVYEQAQYIFIHDALLEALNLHGIIADVPQVAVENPYVIQ